MISYMHVILTICCVFQAIIAQQIPVGFKSIQKCRDYQQSINGHGVRNNRATSNPNTNNASLKKRVPHYPYAVSLHDINGRLLCGGTLISDNFILAAAHCLKNKHISVEQVQLETDAINSKVPVFRNISRILPHPQYTDSQYYNDIGLVELAERVHFSMKIRPACLQARRYIDGDDWFMVTWNRDDEIYKYKTKRISVQAMKLDDCQVTYQDRNSVQYGIIDHLQMCVVEDINEKVTHTPISIVMANKDMTGFTVVGTPSVGVRNQRASEIYTRVSGYIKWIESVVWPGNVESGCSSFNFDVERA